MYFCRECKKYFDSPLRCVERHGLDFPPYEVFYACPICYGNDYIQKNEEDNEA